MLRRASAFGCVAAVLLAGCAKGGAAGAGAGPSVIVVAPTNAPPPIVVGGPVDGPRAKRENDDQHVAGAHMLVEWDGTWVPATLIERRGERWLVHYDEGWRPPALPLEELVDSGSIGARMRHAGEPPAKDDEDP